MIDESEPPAERRHPGDGLVRPHRDRARGQRARAAATARRRSRSPTIPALYGKELYGRWYVNDPARERRGGGFAGVPHADLRTRAADRAPWRSRPADAARNGAAPLSRASNPFPGRPRCDSICSQAADTCGSSLRRERRPVRRLYDRMGAPPGAYSVTWDGRDDAGLGLPAASTSIVSRRNATRPSPASFASPSRERGVKAPMRLETRILGVGAFLGAFLVLGTDAARGQVTLGFAERWPGTSVSSWGGGATVSNPGTGGLDGDDDGFLLVSRTYNGHLGTRSTGPEYAGDWTAAGVTHLRVWLRDVDASQALENPLQPGHGVHQPLAVRRRADPAHRCVGGVRRGSHVVRLDPDPRIGNPRRRARRTFKPSTSDTTCRPSGCIPTRSRESSQSISPPE